MKVQEIMTRRVICCTPETSIQEVARLMRDHNMGAVPVVESEDNPRPVGMVTDRDIAMRAIADGRDPARARARDCMSANVWTVRENENLEACTRVMEEHQVRRVPVVDDRGACCGIIAQADLAINGPAEQTAEVVREISQPSNQPRV